ncbi:MAG TPA: hypothetical protein VGI28_15255 [Stellaceae bacterium]
MADQVIALVAPWSVQQYPGKRRAFAQLIGVGISTARTYLCGQAPLPAYHAERLASFCEQRAIEHTDAARLLRAYGRTRAEEVRRLRGRALMLARVAERDL